METIATKPVTATNAFISLQDMLEHWQGHRRLTRRVIESFPDDKLFSYSIGEMRPFAELAVEMWEMAFFGIEGIATGKWPNVYADGEKVKTQKPVTREDLLKMWDEATEKLNRLWPTVKAERFQENDRAFGMWDGTVNYFVHYFIDNEIHHRGQGYVYLRSLGITPPGFYERY